MTLVRELVKELVGDDGVSDISTGASEGVGGMVNGAGLTAGSIVRS